MNRKISRFVVAALLTATVTPLASGCAFEAPEGQNENVGVVDQALVGISGEDVLEAMAKELLSAAGGELAAALFPGKGIDVEKLLADIDANTRKAIFEEALRNDKKFMDAAIIKLSDYEIEKGTVGKPGSKTAQQIYESVNGDSTLNNIDLTLASVGPESSDQFKRAGLKLFIEAAQVKASRKMLQIQLSPGTATTDTAVLVHHLRTAREHVLAVANAQRHDLLKDRMAQVGECYVYDTRKPYPWSDYSYYVTSYDHVEKSSWGQYDSYDLATAYGRCDKDRDWHYDRVERAYTPEVDAKLAFALKIADQWARTADKLENRAAEQGTAFTGVDFGGMWGYVREAGESTTHGVANPFTNTFGCPTGYTQQAFAGKLNVDYPAYVCVRPSNGVSEPVADFGGMFGQMDYRESKFMSVNPYTKASSCGDGFTKYKVLGDQGADNDLFYCARPHVKGTKVDTSFGGVYSRVGGFENVVTTGMTCAIGTAPTQVWGSNGTHGWKNDQAVLMCSK